MPKSESNPLTVQQVSDSFRVIGWVSFWFQVVLAVISAGILLVAGLSNRPSGPTPNNPASPVAGSGFGVLFAGIGLLLLLGSIYYAYQYTRTARQLLAIDTAARPKKSETMQILKIGLVVSMVGMLLTLFGAFGFVGGLFIKASRQAGAISLTTTSPFINAFDILTVQMILLILLALFVGITTPLWLMNRISR